MKKIKWLAILLIFCQLCVLPVLSADGQGQEIYYGKEADFLKSIGILEDAFDLERETTRSEFAYAVCKMLFQDIDFTREEMNAFFEDVTPETPYYGQLGALKDLHIISGYGDGNFRPDQAITLSEALAILLRALAYEPFVQAQGGYPSGYFVVANDIGLLRGISAGAEALSGHLSAKLLYNALFCNLVVADSIGAGGASYRIEQDLNLLGQRMGILRYDALILNDGMTSVDGSVSPGEGRMIVQNVKNDEKLILDVLDEGVYDYVGYQLTLYVHANTELGRNEIVHYELHNNAAEYMVPAQRIMRAESNLIEFETDRDSGRLNKLTLNSPYVFVNGEKKTVYTAEDLKPEDGFVLLADWDGDGKIDVVKVTSFSYHMLVNSASAENQVITAKNNALYNLDLEDDGQLAYRVIYEGKRAQLGNIQENDIVSVASSQNEVDGKKLYYLYVSRDTVTASAESYTDSSVWLDGSEYLFSCLYKKEIADLSSTVSLEASQTFYLNMLGEVAYISHTGVSGKNYYYLIDIARVEDIAGGVRLQFYSPDGSIEIAELSEKVRIDGKKLDGKSLSGGAADMFDEVRELLCVRPDGSVDIPDSDTLSAWNKRVTQINPRPAIVKRNGDNLITSIDTDAPTYDDPVLEQNDPEVLRAGDRLAKNVIFRNNKGTGSFDGSFYVTAETAVLAVPDVDRYDIQNAIRRYNTNYQYSIIAANLHEKDLTDPNNYLWGAPFESAYYDVQGYNIDPQTGSAGLVIVRGERPTYQAGTGKLSVFTRLVEAYDEMRGELSYRLYYNDGQERSVMIDQNTLNPLFQNIIFGGKRPIAITNPGQPNETATYEDVPALEQGDLICVNVKNGYLSYIHRELDVSESNARYGQSSQSNNFFDGMSYATTAVNAANPPYDARKAGSSNSATALSMTSEFHIAYDLESDMLTSVRPLAPGSKDVLGTMAQYIAGDSTQMWKRFVKVPTSGILVVEEIKHTDAGCEYRVREGNLSDIRLAASYADDGLYRASRIYMNLTYGIPNSMIVYNLTEEHNR